MLDGTVEIIAYVSERRFIVNDDISDMNILGKLDY